MMLVQGRRLLVAALLVCGSLGAFAACNGGGGGPPDPPSCDGYDDAQPEAAGAVTWRIVNATNLPIYLAPAASCSALELGYTLEGPDGDAINPDVGPCGGSCADLQDNGQTGCPDACALPPIRMIPAGGSFEHVWDGSHWQAQNMPQACVANNSSAAQAQPANEPADIDTVDCLQRVLAEPGSYSLAVEAFSVCVNGSELCTCETPEPDGTCRIIDAFQAELTGRMLAANVSFTMPASDVVELRFEESLCAPSAPVPCGEYQGDGCCTGQSCINDPNNGPVCTTL